MKKNSFAAGLLPGLVFTLAAHGAAGIDPFSVKQLTADNQAVSVSRSRLDMPCVADGPGSTPLSLIDVVERALCNNPQTRVAWFNARAQAALTGVAKSAYLPTINASASLSANHADDGTSSGSHDFTQTALGVSLTSLLYDFGARSANLDAARHQLEALNATQNAVLQNVFFEAVRVYYQTFAAQAAVEAAREAEKSSAESLKAASVRYKVGAATPADKMQAQTAYSQAKLNLIRTEGEAKRAQGSLAVTMGLDANAAPAVVPPVAQIPDTLFEANVAELIDLARRQRPELAAAEAEIRVARSNLATTQASGMPSVSLSGSMRQTEEDYDASLQSSSIGIAINIPLFSGFSTTYRVRAAEQEVAARMAQRDRINQQISLEVWSAYYDLSTESQAVRSSQDLLDSAMETERVVLGRYKGGVGSILDLLSAQSALASARQQQIQARYNWHIARAVLAQAMGRLGFDMINAQAEAPVVK